MKKLLKLMLQNYPLRDKVDAAGADGGGADKTADLAAQVAALQAQVQALQKASQPGQPPAPAPAPSKDIVDDVAKKIEAEKLAEQKSKELEAAIRFNLSAQQFVEAKKAFLSERAPRIVEEIAAKQFSTELARARSLQKNLLCDYLSEQANLDALPESLKTRAMEFKKLADDEKETRAADYWDVLTLGVDRKEVIKQAEEAQRANNGYAPRGTFVADYESRVFALGQKKEK